MVPHLSLWGTFKIQAIAQTIPIIQMGVDIDSDQSRSRGSTENWVDSRYILKKEPAGISD
jgi:hypothetical protein